MVYHPPLKKEDGFTMESKTALQGRGYRERALYVYGNKCKCCGRSENIDIHHIDVNRRNNHIKNLIPVCRSCHKNIHYTISRGVGKTQAVKRIYKIKNDIEYYDTIK